MKTSLSHCELQIADPHTMRHTINSRRPSHIYPDCSVLFLVALSRLRFMIITIANLESDLKTSPHSTHSHHSQFRRVLHEIFIYRKHTTNPLAELIHSHTCGVDNEKRVSPVKYLESVRGENEIYAIECTIIIAISYSASFSGPCLVAAVL